MIFYPWMENLQTANKKIILPKTRYLLPARKGLTKGFMEPYSSECHNWSLPAFIESEQDRSLQFCRWVHFSLTFWQRYFIVWDLDVRFCCGGWLLRLWVFDWICWVLIRKRRLYYWVCFELSKDYPYRNTTWLKNTNLPLHENKVTLESFKQLHDVRVFQCCHRINFLDEALFELWIFDHLFLGEAFNCVEGRWGGGFGS